MTRLLDAQLEFIADGGRPVDAPAYVADMAKELLVMRKEIEQLQIEVNSLGDRLATALEESEKSYAEGCAHMMEYCDSLEAENAELKEKYGRLREENEKYVEALKWYADSNRYGYAGDDEVEETTSYDCGHRARNALEKV